MLSCIFPYTNQPYLEPEAAYTSTYPCDTHSFATPSACTSITNS